jgi:hypothetical protein
MRNTDKWNEIKKWVVVKAKVNKPYDKQWNAYTTLEIDINEFGETIEEAYCNLTDRIYKSDFLYNVLKGLTSFNLIKP